MAKSTMTLSKQTFRLIDPDAKQVLLAGDFTGWQKGAVPMKKEGNGLWTKTVELGPGLHSYLFIVDGQWREDRECPTRTANPFGGQNMVRQVA
jgi:1,4-alpha-glucan branching enzyme